VPDDQLVDLEEIVEKALLTTNVDAGRSSCSTPISFCRLIRTVLALILINETWRFYNDCIAR